jgi:uncharacterized protein
VLVIMAKQPAVGQTKTRLSPPLTPVEAAALYEALLRDTVLLAASLNDVQLALAITPPAALASLRLISPPQTLLWPVSGTDIGDCLHQVLSGLLMAGYRRALALNSDGPTLPIAYLQVALTLLEQADVVLGPSEDGGYYLIGIKQPQPDLFRDIAWSTPQVTPQTLARAEGLGLRVALLPPWYDVDTAADLVRLRTELDRLPPQSLPYTRRFLAAHARTSETWGAHGQNLAP